jgi:outer membrane protein assembly factor BamA
VKIVDPEVTAGKITLTFKITKGPKFKIGSVDIKGVPDADKATYLKLFGVKSGDLFTRTGIVTGRDKILEKLKPGANVLPLTKIDMASKTINLTLEITGA